MNIIGGATAARAPASLHNPLRLGPLRPATPAPIVGEPLGPRHATGLSGAGSAAPPGRPWCHGGGARKAAGARRFLRLAARGGPGRFCPRAGRASGTRQGMGFRYMRGGTTFRSDTARTAQRPRISTCGEVMSAGSDMIDQDLGGHTRRRMTGLPARADAPACRAHPSSAEPVFRVSLSGIRHLLPAVCARRVGCRPCGADRSGKTETAPRTPAAPF
jgi:hypothetical protein